MKKRHNLRVDRSLALSRMELLGIPSQSELARMCELDYPNLNRIINGASFSSQTLTKLCGVLQCHPGELLTQGL